MTVTVDSHFLSSLMRFPQRVFLRSRIGEAERTLTYEDASRRIAQIVRSLYTLGFQRGDRLICYLDEMEPSIFISLACASAGILFLPLSPNLSLDAVLRLKLRIRAKGVFTTAERVPVLVERGETPLCSQSAAAPPSGAHLLSTAAIPSAADALTLLEGCAAGHTTDDPYLLHPTSGTTGDPKIVVMPHRCFPISNAGTGHRPLPIDPPERALMVAALIHGLGHLILSTAIGSGAELAVPSTVDAAVRLDEVRALDPTWILCSPRVVRALYNQALARGEEAMSLFGPSCRLLRTGGQPPDYSIFRKLAADGVDVGEAYGASETSSIAGTPIGGWRQGWVGTVDRGAELKVAEDGELLFRSPRRVLGYFEDEELSRAMYTHDGYYRTGDLGEMSDDGHVRVIGRKRDIFNTFDGTNIHPAAIEALIEGWPEVRQAALVGDMRPYLVALIVVSDSLHAQSHEEDGYLDPHQHPARYAHLKALLRNLNSSREKVERVRRVALFSRPMSTELWSPVSAGKVRRKRPAIASAFSARIDALYALPTGDEGWLTDG